MVNYLEEHHVQFEYDTRVTNVEFEITGEKKVARRIVCVREGQETTIPLTENDLVFVTNGSCTENSSLGDNDPRAAV